MEKQTVYIIIFCVALLGAFTWVYYNYDFKNEEIQYSNLSISAESNNQKIKTGYVIETEDGIINGNTSQSYEREVVRKNQIIKVYNKNLKGQSFYRDMQEINLTDSTKRITLKLEEPKEINYEIRNKYPIELYLESQDARNIDFCLDWSLGTFTFIKTNFKEISKPEEYKKWNECYNGNFTLQNSNKTIQINYTKFKTPSDDDFIKIVLLSSDIEGRNPKEIRLV